MIRNDQELQTTKARITQFETWLGNFRRTARPAEFNAVASGYRLEIDRMHAEVLDYLLRPLPDPDKKPQPQAV
jgi:hypothetical protein